MHLYVIHAYIHTHIVKRIILFLRCLIRTCDVMERNRKWRDRMLCWGYFSTPFTLYRLPALLILGNMGKLEKIISLSNFFHISWCKTWQSLLGSSIQFGEGNSYSNNQVRWIYSCFEVPLKFLELRSWWRDGYLDRDPQIILLTPSLPTPLPNLTHLLDN